MFIVEILEVTEKHEEENLISLLQKNLCYELG